MSKKKSTEDGEAKEHKRPWQETIATPEDIRQFLKDHLLLRYNVVTGKTEFRVPEKDEFEALQMVYPTGASPLDEWRSATEWHVTNDRLVDTLWGMIGSVKKTSQKNVWSVINSDFSPLYNPFLSYLNRLPPWDGESNPILDLSMSVTVRGGTEEQLLFYLWLRKWLVGMVAGWIDDKVVNEVILVLIGRQGSYKTTWFNALLPPALESYFHSNTSFGQMTKDEVLKLSYYGLICCEELDAMKSPEMNRLKWAVTTRVTDERKPYALYLRGFRYWFEEGPETELQSRHNERFEVPQYEHDLILTHYRVPKGGEAGEFVSSGDIMQTISGSLRLDLSENKLGRIMRKLGFVNGRSGNLRGFKVIAYKPEEIQANRRLRALEAVEDTCALTMEEIYAVYGGEGEGATNAALF